MTGLAIFAIASLLGGLAQNERLLLGARGLQGLGAALASPAALALITTTFPAGPQRNRAFAVYAAMSGAGAAVGLILGGWLTGLDGVAGIDFSGWRLTFLINVPIGLVAAAPRPAPAGGVRVAPRRARHPRRPHRHPGPARHRLRPDPGRQGGVRLGRPLDDRLAGRRRRPARALRLVIESRVEHPLLPIRILRNRTRAASFVVMMLVPAAMFAMFFFLSLFIQQLVGYSPLRAGFAFLPFSVGIVVGAGPVVQPGQPDRPALPRRGRHPARRRSRCSASRGSRIDDSPTPCVRARRRHHGGRGRELLDLDPAVHRDDVGRHGPDLRAADPDRGAPRAGRGLRHRLRACSTPCSRSAARSGWPR